MAGTQVDAVGAPRHPAGARQTARWMVAAVGLYCLSLASLLPESPTLGASVVHESDYRPSLPVITTFVVLLVQCAPLAVVWRWPVPAAPVTTAGFVVAELLGCPPAAADFAVPVCVGVLVRRRPGRHSRPAVLGSAVVVATGLAAASGEPPGRSTALVIALVVTFAVVPVLSARLGDTPMTVTSRHRGGRSIAGTGLTTREHEVLDLLGDGSSNAQIAARLFVSKETVKSHVASILRKLGVDNRAQAGLMAREHRRPLRSTVHESPG
ncbi:MAG: response regulator transcription factor [Phycicoccus sp.]